MIHSIADLLPFSNQDPLNSKDERQKLLDTLFFFCHLMGKAAHRFLYSQYKEFDAQVSENMCQIRAYQMVLLTKKTSFEEIYNNLVKKNKICFLSLI